LAAEARVPVEGVAAGLLDAPLADAAYNLVSAMYPALLRTPTAEAEQRLLSLVAPGGTLLVVHHAYIDREHALEQGYDPDDYVSPNDVRAMAVERGAGTSWPTSNANAGTCWALARTITMTW
jgi:hypothetical protein